MNAHQQPSKVGILLAVLALLAAALACSPQPTTPTAEPTPVPTETPVITPEGTASASVADLAAATVQILAMVESGGSFTSIWTGSGSIIDPQGLILTNAHVIDDRYDEYSHLGVAILHSSDEPPVLTYLAEIVAVDYGLDLAVIRIATDLEGNPVNPVLPFVALGDSDEVQMGDSLQILGYPGIGGETITFTEGAVSGFTSERSIGGRAWIKTDATIAGGNSGGLGADEAGRLIGVPTRASSGAESGDIVDCRPVVDTNRDGIIDERDTCVPIGGFINGLRPINLALPLIEAARSGVAYQGQGGSQAGPAGGYDISATHFRNLVFSDGVTAGDQPSQILPILPSGVTDACAFWDYQGMVDGMTWSAYWFINETLTEAGSTLGQSWTGGQSGNWWVCLHDEDGLADGVYEIVLEVEDTVLVNDAIFVGGDHPMVDFTLVNQTGQAIFYVLLSPSGAHNWGQDDLGPTETIAAGAPRVFNVPAGRYDLLVMSQTLEHLSEEYGIDLLSAMTHAGPSGTGGPATPQPTAPPEGSALFRIENQGTVPICYVYISPWTETTWGEDWLGPTETIQVGASRDFFVTPRIMYDLLLRDCSRADLADMRSIFVSDFGYTYTYTP
jgi:S1-C subfamily serine protease